MIKHNNNNSNNKTVLRERKPPPTPNFQPTVNGDSNPHFRINPNPTAVSVDGRLLHALAAETRNARLPSDDLIFYVARMTSAAWRTR